MVEQSKFLQRWEKRLLLTVTHKCKTCGSRNHSWRVCLSHFNDWEDVMEDAECSYEEFLAVIHLALTWWPQYLSKIFSYEARCATYGELGHSTKKIDFPIRANKKLLKFFKDVKRHHQEDLDSESDFEVLREVFEQEGREKLEKDFRSAVTCETKAHSRGCKGGGEPHTKEMVVALQGSKEGVPVCEKHLQVGEFVEPAIEENFSDTSHSMVHKGTEFKEISMCVSEHEDMYEDARDHKEEATQHYEELPNAGNKGNILIC